jgi:peptide subunit release factor RF-3
MLVNVSHIKRIDYSYSVNIIGISNNGAIAIKETIEEIKQLIKNK